MNDLFVCCANQSKIQTLCSCNKYNYLTFIYAYLLYIVYTDTVLYMYIY